VIGVLVYWFSPVIWRDDPLPTRHDSLAANALPSLPLTTEPAVPETFPSIAERPSDTEGEVTENAAAPCRSSSRWHHRRPCLNPHRHPSRKQHRRRWLKQHQRRLLKKHQRRRPEMIGPSAQWPKPTLCIRAARW
jgi:hypothetical protein